MNTLYPPLSPSPPSSRSWRSSLWPSSPTSNGGTATRSPGAARAIEAEGARAVEVSGIRKGFGGQAPALDGVDLTIEAGELLALLGPSGSGKTTLLRVIAGLEIPDSGRVLFGGHDVTDVAVQEREIGFVFQHYALFRHLSVFDNVAYGLRARRRTRPPESVIRERVSTLLDLVQLGALAGRHPAQLSGGQRQRVALARAIATNPRILLLDEPFGALDARVRKDLRRWLREIHRETGQTTIFVTHDQDEALELADRVAILNRGRIEQVGTPDIVHDHPASAFVAGFVGDGVQIPVTITGGTARFGSRALMVPASGVPDGPAVLFLRAGDIALGDAGPGSLDGTVRDVRRVGNGRRVDVQIEDLLLDVEIGARVEPPAVGSVIGLLPSGGRIFARG